MSTSIRRAAVHPGGVHPAPTRTAHHQPGQPVGASVAASVWSRGTGALHREERVVIDERRVRGPFGHNPISTGFHRPLPAPRPPIRPPARWPAEPGASRRWAARPAGGAGVAQHPVVVPDDDRGVLRPDPETTEQCLGLLILLRVDPPVRQPVAGGELAQPPGIRRVAGADDPEPCAQANQQRAADQAGPQNQVAKLTSTGCRYAT
jgi:hypothetical protein